MIALDLTPYRAVYTSSLTTPCSIRRPDKEVPAGLSTGTSTIEVGSTVCAINLVGGSNNPFINSLVQAITIKTPGQRTLSFKWDEDVQTGDMVVTAQGTYKLGVVNNDDPMRLGIQVSAEIVRVPA